MNIAIIDSTIDFKSFLQNHKKFSMIVTMDYYSHDLLFKKNIEHTISDSFLTETQLLDIQEKSYDLSTWYENKDLHDFLFLDDINIGQLYKVEFNLYLLPILKKVSELKKIFELYPKSNFITSKNISQIFSNLTYNISTLNEYEKLDSEMFLDSIAIPLKIHNKTLFWNIKRSKYDKINEILNIIFSLFFSYKKRYKKNSPSILFVEFNTNRYKKLFDLSKKTNHNFIFFNKRRPYIWDKNSFFLFLFSNIGIVKSKSSSNIKNTMEEKINQHESFFKNFFSISDTSFWNLIKEDFHKFLERKQLESQNAILSTKNLLKKISFSMILIFNESGLNEQIIIHFAKKYGIKIIMLQHGLSWETNETKKIRAFSGNFPIKSDKFLVWGNIVKNFCLDNGIPKEKIQVSGSMLYDDFKNIPKSKNDYVLFATSSPQNNHIFDYTVSTNTFYEKSIIEVVESVKKFNKQLIVKLHPSEFEIDITQIIKKIDPSILILKHVDILPLISSCEVLITHDTSTTILEGLIFEKPIISLKTKSYFGIPVTEKFDACVNTDIENFSQNFEKIINNKKFRNEIIKNGKLFLNNYLSFLGNSSDELLKNFK